MKICIGGAEIISSSSVCSQAVSLEYNKVIYQIIKKKSSVRYRV